MREVVAFNQDGSKYGRMELPEMFYLETERDFIEKTITRSPNLDGIVILIDWNERNITCLRNLKD